MKLIPLDAVLAKIEKELSYYKNLEDRGIISEAGIAAYRVIRLFKSDIDSLEVKEVDIEDTKKEELAQKYIDYTFKRHNIDPESKEGLLIYYAYMHGMNQCLNQLKAQKGV